MDKKNVLEIIEERLPKMSKGQRAIAEYIRDNHDTAVFMTAAQIGNAINVSESTVVRFASSLGYNGFPDFMQNLVTVVKGNMNAPVMFDVDLMNSSQSQIINSVLRGDIDKINSTLADLDTVAFETAVDALISAKTVYIVGIRTCSPLAEFLAFYLRLIRENVICVTTTSTSETFEQMIRVNENDAVVGISFPRYSMRTLKAMEFASDRNAKVINLTDNMHSPVCMYSNINLFAQCNMASIIDSLVAPLSVINALIIAACQKVPETVSENITNLEKAWNDYQVYLSDEIDYMDEDSIAEGSTD